VRVIITPTAEADLETIADYIALDSPRRALSFIRELRETSLALSGFPEAFPLVPRYEHCGVRRKPYGNYLIFYEIADDAVFVTHILNSAQDYEEILFPES